MSVWRDRTRWRFRIMRQGRVMSGNARTEKEARELEAYAANTLHLQRVNIEPLPRVQHFDARYAGTLLDQARHSAIRRMLPFSLERKDIAALFHRAGGRCELTGIPFTNDREPGMRIRPWIPSIDRIDACKGYEPDNCRLVCAYVNVLLNNLGDAAFARVARAFVAKQGVSVPLGVKLTVVKK